MCLKPAVKVTWALLLNTNDTITICSLMKRRTMSNKSVKRKRDREPSRIPVQRILKLLRPEKKCTEKLSKINWDKVFQSPHSSQRCVAISRIWTPSITWQWPFLLQICLVMLKPKQISRHKYCICKEGCIHTCTYILQNQVTSPWSIALFIQLFAFPQV